MLLNFSDAAEQVLPEPVIAHSAIVALDISVLLRVARLNKYQFDIAFGCPFSQHTADVLRAIITADLSRLTTPFNYLVKRANHPRSEERRVGKECRARWSSYD